MKYNYADWTSGQGWEEQKLNLDWAAKLLSILTLGIRRFQDGNYRLQK